MVNKLANFNLPDYLHNWIAHNLSCRQHQTNNNGIMSSMLPISASIIQGSALGPVEYVFTDLICPPSYQPIAYANMLMIPTFWFQLSTLKQYHKNYNTNTYQTGLPLII